jgi:hypothetical protein
MSILTRFQFSGIWLQAHFEIIEDRLLVGFRCGGFLELHVTHHDLVPFRQFFAFRLGIDAGGLFHLPHPIQTLRNLRNPRCPSRTLLLPLNVRFFAGCPARRTLSKATFFMVQWRGSWGANGDEWPASAPSLSLTPQPGWIAAALSSWQSGSLPPAAACFPRSTRPLGFCRPLTFRNSLCSLQPRMPDSS